ncbi:MAG TPA: NAD(P)H-dependent oxidoreductase [Acidimicrobiales bacterium]
MSYDPLRLAVIVGSTRDGRFGHVVARWFAGQVRTRRDMDLDVIDLAEVELPAAHPSGPTPALDAYLARLDRADAFAIVTPEYNHGYPASLKHAIDLARDEWKAKPVGFVSYGGISGGLRAVEQLRQVFPELHATTVRDTVSFAWASRAFDEAGEPLDAAGCNAAAQTMLDQLAWWGRVLRNARRADAAASAVVA